MGRILIIAIILGVLTAGGIFLLVRNPEKTQTITDDSSLYTGDSDTVLSSTEIYNDEAGFSFKYPVDSEVKDITPNDDSYYSLLSVSKGASALTIRVQDGMYTPPTGAKLIGAVALGGMKGSQYSYDKNGDTYQVTFTNVEGIIYLIESKKDNGFLDEAHTIIADSFMIGSQTKSTGGSSVIDEGEEIVE